MNSKLSDSIGILGMGNVFRDSMRVNIPRTIIEKREEEDGDEDMDDEMDMDESMMGMDDDEDDEPMNDSEL